MIKRSFTTMWQVSRPEVPVPDSSVEIVSTLIDEWDPNKYKVWPELVRSFLCKISIFPFNDSRQEQFRDWACQEAPNWWPLVFAERPATREELIRLSGMLF